MKGSLKRVLQTSQGKRQKKRKEILSGKTSLNSKISVIPALFAMRRNSGALWACDGDALKEGPWMPGSTVFFCCPIWLFALFLHFERKLFLLYRLFPMSGHAMSFFIRFWLVPAGFWNVVCFLTVFSFFEGTLRLPAENGLSALAAPLCREAGVRYTA